MGKSVGIAIGAVVGGFCNEIFYSHVDLFMALSLYLMAVACTCLPLVDELWFVFLMMMLTGIGEGVLNTGDVACTLVTIHQKINMQEKQFGYSWCNSSHRLASRRLESIV